jgi:chromosome segregation ATPase
VKKSQLVENPRQLGPPKTWQKEGCDGFQYAKSLILKENKPILLIERPLGRVFNQSYESCPMHDKKDIADLLEEVQAIVHNLRDEKSDLRDQVSGLEAQLSLVEEEKRKQGRNLQDINEQLTKELGDTKVRLTRELQDAQQKLDRFHPELQSLQDELHNAELQNDLLKMELSKKNEEIKTLEGRLSSYTSLSSTSLPVGESIA